MGEKEQRAFKLGAEFALCFQEMREGSFKRPDGSLCIGESGRAAAERMKVVLAEMMGVTNA